MSYYQPCVLRWQLNTFVGPLYKQGKNVKADTDQILLVIEKFWLMRTLIPPFRLLTTRGESVKSTDTAQALWQTYCGGKSNLKEKLSSSFFLRVRLFTYTKNLLTRGGSVWAYYKTLLDEVGLITYSLLIPSWMIALHYAPYMANVTKVFLGQPNHLFCESMPLRLWSKLRVEKAWHSWCVQLCKFWNGGELYTKNLLTLGGSVDI